MTVEPREKAEKESLIAKQGLMLLFLSLLLALVIPPLLVLGLAEGGTPRHLWLAFLGSLLFVGVVLYMAKKVRNAIAKAEACLPLRELAQRTNSFGFWERDLHTDKVYLSTLAREFIGQASNETLFDVELLFERLHPDDLVRVKDTYARALQEKSAYDLVYRIRFNDGTWHWMELHGEVACDVHGEPQRTIGIFCDITARKVAEKSVLEQAQLLDMIFEHAQDGIAILDKDYNFIRVNEAYARYGQRPANSFTGVNHFDLYPSDFQQEMEPFRLSKKVYRRSARPFRYPEHPEWDTTYWDVAMVPILGNDGEIELFLLSLKDVTVAVRAVETSKDYIRRLEALSARIIAVQEAERSALAHELHDEIGQGLTAVKIRMQTLLSNSAVSDRPSALGTLEEALATVSKLLEQVRSLSLDLRPMQLDDLGLKIALASLLERNANTAGWEVHQQIDLPPGPIDHEVELACYRVVQEALTNVMRHATASKVWMTLESSENTLRLMVRDNGTGFDSATVESRPTIMHFGLFGMEGRVRNLNGQFEICSSPGNGTTIHASFPLPANQKEAS